MRDPEPGKATHALPQNYNPDALKGILFLNFYFMLPSQLVPAQTAN